MNEREVQGLIVKSLATKGWRLFKIVDGAAGKTPFDICGVSPSGIGVAIEVKTERPPRGSEAALPWGDFATHQKAWLKVYAEADAHAIVAIHDGESNAVILYEVAAHDVDSPTPRSWLQEVKMEYRSAKNLYVISSELPWK